jgi:hypothetical protein
VHWLDKYCIKIIVMHGMSCVKYYERTGAESVLVLWTYLHARNMCVFKWVLWTYLHARNMCVFKWVLWTYLHSKLCGKPAGKSDLQKCITSIHKDFWQHRRVSRDLLIRKVNFSNVVSACLLRERVYQVNVLHIWIQFYAGNQTKVLRKQYNRLYLMREQNLSE